MSVIKRKRETEFNEAKRMKKDFEKDNTKILLQRTIMNGNIDRIFHNSQVTRIDKTKLLSFQVTPLLSITDQESTGRCWMFSDLHPAATLTSKKYRLGLDFYFSTAYLFFWHKFESIKNSLKVFTNYQHHDMDSRLLSFLSYHPVHEGGYCGDTRNIVERYGLLPVNEYKDTYHSKNSNSMNTVLKSLVRHHMYLIKNATSRLKARELCDKAITHAFDTLCIFLGTPPSSFTFEYREKSKIIRKKLTPIEFYTDYVPYKYTDQMYLCSDPRFEAQKKMRIPAYLNNTYRADCDLLNQTPKKCLEYVKKCIRKNISVPFTTDVDKDNKDGIMDIDLYDFSLFGIGTIPSKEKIVFNHTHGNHCMNFVGYDEDKKMLKVANSWGTNYGKSGYWYMTEKWFNEYVHRVTIPKEHIHRLDLAAFENNDVEHTYDLNDIY